MRVLAAISYFLFFFMKRFYPQKHHKMQTNDFQSDIFILQKVLKGEHAIFIHKKQQNAK